MHLSVLEKRMYHLYLKQSYIVLNSKDKKYKTRKMYPNDLFFQLYGSDHQCKLSPGGQMSRHHAHDTGSHTQGTKDNSGSLSQTQKPHWQGVLAGFFRIA